MYTKGLADLNQNGLSQVLILADEGLKNKTKGTPRRQPKLCNNNWKMYPNGAKKLDL